MTLRHDFLSHFAKIAACAVILTGANVYAQDAKPDPAGTWTWTAPGRNGGPDRTNTLVLQVENSKLTGNLAAPGRGGQVSEIPVSDGKVNGDSISFTIVREVNGNFITNKYAGKIEADKIHGAVQFSRNGEDQSRDWQASRSTAVK
jgi:hypothetical protein